jgi:hypothetical protein
MAHKRWILAVGLIMAASPLSAQPEVTPPTAPAGGPTGRASSRDRACTAAHIAAVAGSSNKQWAEQGVDVDKDWPKEGVAVEA